MQLVIHSFILSHSLVLYFIIYSFVCACVCFFSWPIDCFSPLQTIGEKLQQSVLDFTCRLHSAEVERKNLRTELNTLRTDTHKHATEQVSNLQQQVSSLQQKVGCSW